MRMIERLSEYPEPVSCVHDDVGGHWSGKTLSEKGMFMKLAAVRLCNFQSFAEPTSVSLDSMTFLIGPNGAGKTAVLTGLARMFGTDPMLRHVVRSDFHVAKDAAAEDGKAASLWIEAEFTLGEAKAGKATGAVPVFFTHMQLVDVADVPRIRIRLTAELDETGEIEQKLEYVLAADKDGNPLQLRTMPKSDRQAIHVYYLPARRNPADHVSYAAGSLLGRLLRAADWTTERKAVVDLGEQLGDALGSNPGVAAIGTSLAGAWAGLHKGEFFKAPAMAFAGGQLEQVLRQVSISFGPAHDEPSVDFARLSDGQQSLLYLSLVLSMHAIGRKVLSKELDVFDIDRLRPPVFTLVAMEEPENSLSPHYLGRVVASLRELARASDGQALVATHAPSMLSRIKPEQVRYLRLDSERRSTVRTIAMPDTKKDDGEAEKFVREAVMAYPELYFSRLVILGEGDSEEIVLPRLLAAHGLESDLASICVAPLGGRHVHHFWRLLEGLGIPYVTLLDLDLGRYGGGWGRIRTAHRYLRQFPAGHATRKKIDTDKLPKWDTREGIPKEIAEEIMFLEKANVFFSSPLDLDFAMLRAFKTAYEVDDAELRTVNDAVKKSVLGKKGISTLLSDGAVEYLGEYHHRFKAKSKPVTHLRAMADLDNATLEKTKLGGLSDLVKRVTVLLKAIPE
jgi:putative ATP-dependent endonuclease of the OLD family